MKNSIPPKVVCLRPFIKKAHGILPLGFAILLVFSCQSIFGQASDPMPAMCGMSDSIAPSGQGGQPAPGSMTCDSHSGDPVFSDLGRFLPPTSTRSIGVHVNFIVLQKLDGTGNFQDIPEHRAFLDEWLATCNSTFANLWGSGDPDCQVPASDAKVEIIPNWIFMIDPSIDEYYWDNTNNPGWTDCPNKGSWWLNALDASLNSNPSIPRGINVYFTNHGPVYHQLVTLQTIDNPQDAGMPYTWCSEWPSRTDLQQPSRVHIANLYLKYYWFKNFLVDGQPFSVTRGWLVGEGATLAHEFGHSFIQEYNHETFGCENHLLSTGGWRTVLRELDVEYIHRGLVYNSLRQFIDCDETYHHNVWSSENEWVIDEDETWKLDMRLYNHVRVSAGATLTITCKVLMPQWGIITLERGARLIVNGGQVQRANTCGPEEYWHGIYAQGNSNLNQPDPNGVLNAAQGSVVLLYGDGMIEGAKRGISTSFSPFGDIPAYRGALIQANEFTFKNCSKGVEFNKYNHPNFSNFYDTHFLRTNTGSMGATAYRCGRRMEFCLKTVSYRIRSARASSVGMLLIPSPKETNLPGPSSVYLQEAPPCSMERSRWAYRVLQMGITINFITTQWVFEARQMVSSRSGATPSMILILMWP